MNDRTLPRSKDKDKDEHEEDRVSPQQPGTPSTIPTVVGCAVGSNVPPVPAFLAGLTVSVSYPAWVAQIARELDLENRAFATDAEKMQLAIEISRRNIHAETGGPFGSVIFNRKTGKVLALGMNQVVPKNNPTLHGEMVAIMMATHQQQSYTLGKKGMPEYELFTSAEPCGMCLTAALWSGVKRVVSAAKGEDVRAIGFDEGPVFEDSYEYLRNKGVEIVRNVEREDAVAVLQEYAKKGEIYNG